MRKPKKGLPVWAQCMAKQAYEYNLQDYKSLDDCIEQLREDLTDNSEANNAMEKAFKDYANKCCKSTLEKAADFHELVSRESLTNGQHIVLL